jgi:prefoldin alpha subunit
MNEVELQQKFQVFEQQIMYVQDQLRVVEQAIFDMNTIYSGLDELKDKKDEKIIAPIGRGIFVKAKLLEENLLVDVGSRNFVTKTIPETKDLILDQVEKLKISKKELESELEKINQEITLTMKEFQGRQ